MIALFLACMSCLLPSPVISNGDSTQPIRTRSAPRMPLGPAFAIEPEELLLPSNVYRGTHVTINPNIKKEEIARKFASYLAGADWMPPERLHYFAIYSDPSLSCNRWLLHITNVQEIEGGVIVTVKATPQMTTQGGGLILTDDNYHENYLFTGNITRYLGGKGNYGKSRGMLFQF